MLHIAKQVFYEKSLAANKVEVSKLFALVRFYFERIKMKLDTQELQKWDRDG